ncbi:deoxyguanosinetriphosphate triphosphohydrolase-like protein [compost metagenome]
MDGLLDTPSRVALLRAKAINTLIKGCVDVFVREQEQFLSGTFSSALMDALDDSIVKQMSKISKISIAKIYNAPTVVQIEIAGYRVMDALLKEFVPAYLKKNKNNYDKKLVALIPEQFYTDKQDSYSKIRSVLDFVSGMTDVYAIELYRKIKGITIPSIE